MALSNSKTDSAHFKTLLAQKGIYEAIRFLNAKSVHRFTALYEFEGKKLKNVCLVDKETDSVQEVETIEVTDSYCFYVRDSGQKFLVPNSLADERVEGHPKQATIQSYCGMPIVSDNAMLGTLCHFDFIARPYTDEEVRLMEQVTPDLARWLEDSSARQ
jgi:GAF domain-containing protein